MRCYGYDESGLKIVESEAAVIRDCARRLLADESMRSLVADLRERNVLTSAGMVWTQHSLSRLLVNPRLIGLQTRLGEVVGEGAWEAILDAETQSQLVAILGNPDRKSPNATNVRRYLLTGGFLECGYKYEDGRVCGHHLHSQPSNSGKRGYVCRKAAPSYGCGRIRIAAESLEDEVATRALARLASPGVRARIEEQLRSGNGDGGNLAGQLSAIDERLIEAGKEYATRAISMPTLKAIEIELKAERKRLKEHADRAERLKTLPKLTPDALAKWWIDAPLERRRDLLVVVLDRVIVRPATRRGYMHLDTERLEFVWR